MEKICLIYQPCGLGDILFLQKFARIIKNKGYEIYWPVIHELEWLNNYIPDFNFISWGDRDKKLTGPPLPESIQFPYKEYYSPKNKTHFSENFIFFNGFSSNPNYKIMAYKYHMANMDYNDWANYLIFNRNKEKEKYLFYKILKLSDNESYTFINKYYQLRPNILSFNHLNNLNFSNKIVELKFIDGYSLFDWSKVIENASEIYMIETALNYIMESNVLNIKTDSLHLYSRYNNFSEVDYLFNLKWTYHKW